MILELLFIVLLIWFIFKPGKLKSLSGPRGWPLIGNSLQVDATRPFVTTAKWAKEYGPVFKMSVAGSDVVVVTGSKAIKEVLFEKGVEFADKHVTFRFDMFSFRSNVAFQPYNEKWKLMRKMLFQGLKQHNVKHIERITLEIIQDFVNDIMETKGQVFDPSLYVRNALLQILHVMIFSSKLEKGDPQLDCIKKLERLSMESLSPVGKGALLDVFPFIRYLGNETYDKLKEFRREIKDLYSQWKENVRKECVDGGWFKETLAKVQNSKILNENNMMMMTGDFFAGGLATSSGTINTIINVLVHYPEVQNRLQLEVDAVVGQGRPVCLGDRESMPYTRACILEALRFVSVIPLTIHCAYTNTTLAGYNIPKGTVVMPNHWAQDHDPDIWPDPFTFKPNRFLKEDGTVVPVGEGPRKHLYTFGGGPRSCVGETLALTRIFLFLASTAQKFSVLPATTLEEQPTIHPENDFILGLTLHPKPYKVRMEKRD